MGTSARQAPTPRHPGGSGGGVASFDTRVGAVTLQASDITGLGGELVPIAPSVFGKTLYTDGVGGAFWAAAGAGAVASFDGRTGVVTLQASDIVALGGVLMPAPPLVFGKSIFADGSGGAFWADPSSGGSGSGVDSFDGRTGAVLFRASDVTGLGGALVPPAPATFGNMMYADGSGGIFWAAAPSGGGGGGSGVTTWNGRSGTVSLLSSDIIALGGGLVPSASGVAFGKQLTADGSGGTFWG